MNDASILEQLGMTDVHGPEMPMPATAWSRETALSEIERRIGIMQTQKRAELEETPRRTPGRRPLAAVAAFVVVAVAVGIVAMLTRDRAGDVADGASLAETFAEIVNTGDDLSPLVTEDATFGPMTVPLDQDLVAFWAGLDTSLEVSDCRSEADMVTCGFRSTDRIREVLGRPEVGTITFLVEDARIARISRNVDPDASGWFAESVGDLTGDPVIDYMEWLNANYPGWEQELDWIGEPYALPGRGGFAPLGHDDPVKNARYAEVLIRHLDDYAADLAATGGLPEVWDPDRWVAGSG